MMDLREIIKWFIPCFHILLVLLKNSSVRLTFICLFLLFNICPGCAAVADSGIQVQTKNVSVNQTFFKVNVNQSDIISHKKMEDVSKDISEGRTFGRPFKKMIGAMIPLIFQLGAASTWAVVAALVGIKTLAITLFILKLLLVAGALKLGALFGQKHHHGWEPPHHGWEPPHHGWEPPHPQKEIHLHIHNGQAHEEQTPYAGWSRTGAVVPTNVADTKNINVIYEPNPDGPQTISTPYGNYIKVQSALPAPVKKRK